MASRPSCGTAPSAAPRYLEQAAFYGDGFFHNNIFWPKEHVQRMVDLYRRRFEHYGHGTADQAIVGLGGQVYMRHDSQAAIREFRPYFDKAPVYGGGPSLEDYMDQTPLTVGSPQQVIDRTLTFRDIVGDYQRQLFLVDHAGLPLKAALEQLEMLGTEVVPVLRAEFAKLRKPGVPDAPTHASLKASATGASATRTDGLRVLVHTDRLLGGLTMATRTIAVVSAGLSQPSATRLLADRLAAATVTDLRTRDIDAQVTVVEAREHARDLADHLLTGFPSPKLKTAISAISSADGVIAVSPIFSASYSGLFKMLFDVLGVDALDGMPVLVGATGGTPRHSLAIDHALRPLFAYLGAAVVPTGVFAATDDWGDPDWAASLAARIERAADGTRRRASRTASRPNLSTRSPTRSPSTVCWPDSSSSSQS